MTTPRRTLSASEWDAAYRAGRTSRRTVPNQPDRWLRERLLDGEPVDVLPETDEERHARLVAAARKMKQTHHLLYATKGERAVYFNAAFRHTVNPEFSYCEVNESTEELVTRGEGHPRRNGYTKRNGWTLNPEWQGASF